MNASLPPPLPRARHKSHWFWPFSSPSSMPEVYTFLYRQQMSEQVKSTKSTSVRVVVSEWVNKWKEKTEKKTLCWGIVKKHRLFEGVNRKLLRPLIGQWSFHCFTASQHTHTHSRCVASLSRSLLWFVESIIAYLHPAPLWTWLFIHCSLSSYSIYSRNRNCILSRSRNASESSVIWEDDKAVRSAIE